MSEITRIDLPSVRRSLGRRTSQTLATWPVRLSRITAFTLFSLLSCKLWSGMARHGRPPSPRTGNKAFQVFHESRVTNHETRLFRPFPFTGRQAFLLERIRPPTMVFTNHETRLLLPPENGFLPRDNGFLPPDYDFLPNHNESKTRYSSEFVGIRRNYSDNPPSRCPRAVRTGKTACWVFKNHESRITRHETRLFLLFSLLSCKLWSGMGRLWRGMGGHRPPPPHRQQGLYGFHESRLFRPFPFTGRQTFLLEQTRPPTMLFTSHGFYAFLAAFLQVVERHGAAMARHGRPPSPAPATRPFRFFTNHETRNTAFILFTNHSFPTHDFPPFPGISHHFPAPPPPSAVLGRPHRARRQPPLPPPAGKHKNGSPREHDSNVNL